MPSSSENHQAAWLRLAELLGDDLETMSEEEFVAELAEDGVDDQSTANSIRDAISEMIINRYKERLDHARRDLRQNKTPTEINKLDMTDEEKRDLLKRFESNRGPLPNDLTLAARKADELSVDDIESMVQTLFELGLIDDQGNIR